jgi:hypothetical protein
MATDKPEWELLEIIVADIQKQLAPNAEVRHNHRVTGKSGRRRKLDVTVSQKVGTSPVFIVFDCKHHKRTVKLKDVAAFSVQLEDVSATLGVMISNSGFDAGAKAIAKQKSILLQTYRKASETDWKALLGEQSWGILTKVEIHRPRVLATFLRETATQEETAFNTPMYDENGETLDTLEDAFWEMWKQIGQPTGDFSGQVYFEGLPFFIRENEKLIQIQDAIISAHLVPKKFIVNWQLAKGDIIENEDRTQPIYRSLASQGIDWAEIINNQPGIEISPEEYQQILNETKLRADLRNAKRFIRIVAQDKDGPAQSDV